MKHIKLILIFISVLLVLNSCSTDSSESKCPEIENISMKINGEFKEFQVIGWGIDLNNDGSSHTLTLQIHTGVFNPEQDSYDITLKLPYKKNGVNLIEEFNYFRVQNGTVSHVNFVTGEFQSKVTVNKNTCFSGTFSGRAVIDGNEIIITEGILNHVYADPFD